MGVDEERGSGIIYVATYRRKNMAITDAQYKAQQKYDKKTARYYSLKLNRVIDKDIIEWFDKQESIQGKIKELVRKEIKKGK